MAQDKNTDQAYRLETVVSGLTKDQAEAMVNEFAKAKNQIAPEAQATGKIMAANQRRDWLGPIRRGLAKKDPFTLWRIVLVFVICWLPYVIVTFPGNLAGDSGTGISDFLGYTHETPNNPWFQNMFMAGFYSFGKWLGNPDIGIFIYCILQTALYIAVLSLVISELGQRSRAAGYMLLALYCLVPVFPLFAFQMGKDSNFALAIMVFVVYALRELKDSGFWQDKRSAGMIMLMIVLMGLFRNSAGWVPGIAFLLYAVFAVRTKPVIKMSVAVLAVVVATAVLPGAFGVPKVETRENMSMPLQTMAYYATEHPYDMTDEDKAIISSVIDYDTMLSRYDRNIADNIKNKAKFNEKTTGPFLQLWFRKFLKHPLTMINGMWLSNAKYIIPDSYGKIKPHVVVGYWLSDYFHEKLGLYNRNPNLTAIGDYVISWLKAPVVDLFIKIGLYTILLIVLVILAFAMKMPRYLFCLSPLLMVLIGCLLSPVNGYYRYAFPMIASVPIVAADMGCVIRDRIKSHSPRPAPKPRKKKQPKLQAA